MLVPFGIAIIYAVLASHPRTAGNAFYVGAVLIIAYLAVTDALTDVLKSIAAAVVVGAMMMTSFGPLGPLLQKLANREAVYSERYQPVEARRARVDPRIGRLARVRADRDGHFRVQARLGAGRIMMMVDTGATTIALSYADAIIVLREHVKKLQFRIPIQTANGVTYAAFAGTYMVKVGDLHDIPVDVLVAPPGALTQSLLGSTYLNALTRYEISGGELVMYQDKPFEHPPPLQRRTERPDAVRR